MAWNSLEDHQRSRVMTFLDPMRDPKGAGYQVIQSKVAIGSGGMTGRGSAKVRRRISPSCPRNTRISFSACSGNSSVSPALLPCFLCISCFCGGRFRYAGCISPFVNLVVAGACTIFLPYRREHRDDDRDLCP